MESRNDEAQDVRSGVYGGRYAAFDVVALATSAGGIGACGQGLARLPADFPAAVIVVMHRSHLSEDLTPGILGRRSALPVVSARDGEALRPSTVFVAPPHGQTTIDDTGRLRVESPDRAAARCRADALFESVARVAGTRSIGVVLTGRLSDGARGCRAIKHRGGRVLVQDPATAAAPDMPRAALAGGSVDFVLPLGMLGTALTALVMAPGGAELFRVAPPAWCVLDPLAV